MSAVSDEKAFGSAAAKIVIVVDYLIFELIDIEILFGAYGYEILDAQCFKPFLDLFVLGVVSGITFREDGNNRITVFNNIFNSGLCLGGVHVRRDHVKDHVSAAACLVSSSDTHRLNEIISLADTGRIDQCNRDTVDIHLDFNSISRGSGNLCNDRPVKTCESIKKSALSAVGKT